MLKSLHGLKQARQNWYDTLSHALTDLGFQVNHADPGVFISHQITIPAIHIYNCLITGSLPKLIVDYKSKLNEPYSLTDLVSVHWLLGIELCAAIRHTIFHSPRCPILTPSYYAFPSVMQTSHDSHHTWHSSQQSPLPRRQWASQTHKAWRQHPLPSSYYSSLQHHSAEGNS